ncbi:MAG TPA: hypothetical protein VK859_01120, partial [bacterium]|nr:hypothetical protein [bacterium]
AVPGRAALRRVSRPVVLAVLDVLLRGGRHALFSLNRVLPAARVAPVAPGQIASNLESLPAAPGEQAVPPEGRLFEKVPVIALPSVPINRVAVHPFVRTGRIADPAMPLRNPKREEPFRFHLRLLPNVDLIVRLALPFVLTERVAVRLFARTGRIVGPASPLLLRKMGKLFPLRRLLLPNGLPIARPNPEAAQSFVPIGRAGVHPIAPAALMDVPAEGLTGRRLPRPRLFLFRLPASRPQRRFIASKKARKWRMS